MGKSLLNPKIIAKLKCDAEFEDKKDGNKNDLSVLQKENVVKNTAQEAHLSKQIVSVSCNLSKKTFTKEEITPDLLEGLIAANCSFEITGLGLSKAMLKMISQIESVIEQSGKTCRVYTAERTSAVETVTAIPSKITQLAGIVANIGIGIHNFVTYNPDYEIVRHLLDNKLSIIKKEIVEENGKRKSRSSILGDFVETVAEDMADKMLENARKKAIQDGEEKEFLQKEAEFNRRRAEIKKVFRNLQEKNSC